METLYAQNHQGSEPGKFRYTPPDPSQATTTTFPSGIDSSQQQQQQKPPLRPQQLHQAATKQPPVSIPYQPMQQSNTNQSIASALSSSLASAWDDHNTKRNPFQNALEYAPSNNNIDAQNTFQTACHFAPPGGLDPQNSFQTARDFAQSGEMQQQNPFQTAGDFARSGGGAEIEPFPNQYQRPTNFNNNNNTNIRSDTSMDWQLHTRQPNFMPAQLKSITNCQCNQQQYLIH